MLPFGITAEELRTQMVPDVSIWQLRLGITAEEMLDKLKIMTVIIFRGRRPMFQSFQFAEALFRRDQLLWFEVAPTYIIEMLRKCAVLPSEIGGEKRLPVILTCLWSWRLIICRCFIRPVTLR